MRIALTGGIACGKSLVAKYLNEFGVETIDADDIVHEILPDPVERRRIAAEVFADPEKRRALEARIHPLVKERINEFLKGGREGGQRSEVRKEVRGQRSEVRGREGEVSDSDGHLHFSPSTSPLDAHLSSHASLRLAIIPLLFETRWDADYDIIVCVASERETQIRRMTTTRGYTREEAEARLKAQMPVGEKADKSHYIIENNGSQEELREKTGAFVEWLKGVERGQ